MTFWSFMAAVCGEYLDLTIKRYEQVQNDNQLLNPPDKITTIKAKAKITEPDYLLP